MENAITKIFSDMTDKELVLAIQEMKEDGSFVRTDGIVREKCQRIHEIVGGNTYEQLMMVQVSILREAAYRFTPTIDELTHND